MDAYDYGVTAGIARPTFFSEIAERYWHADAADPRVVRSNGHNIRCGCSVCSWLPNLLAVIGTGFCSACRRALDDHGPGLKCAGAA